MRKIQIAMALALGLSAASMANAATAGVGFDNVGISVGHSLNMTLLGGYLKAQQGFGPWWRLLSSRGQVAKIARISSAAMQASAIASLSVVWARSSRPCAWWRRLGRRWRNTVRDGFLTAQEISHLALEGVVLKGHGASQRISS